MVYPSAPPAPPSPGRLVHRPSPPDAAGSIAAPSRSESQTARRRISRRSPPALSMAWDRARRRRRRVRAASWAASTEVGDGAAPSLALSSGETPSLGTVVSSGTAAASFGEGLAGATSLDATSSGVPAAVGAIPGTDPGAGAASDAASGAFLPTRALPAADLRLGAGLAAFVLLAGAFLLGGAFVLAAGFFFLPAPGSAAAGLGAAGLQATGAMASGDTAGLPAAEGALGPGGPPSAPRPLLLTGARNWS